MSIAGRIDCENGIDELGCDILELNECDPVTEFRCRNGLCIDLNLAFDTNMNCMDWSDEDIGALPVHFSNAPDEICARQFHTECHYRFCGAGMFPCGDGTCTSSLWNSIGCANQRHFHYVRYVLTQSASSEISCWFFIVCKLGHMQFFPEFDSSDVCKNNTCSQPELLFPFEQPIAHPSVQFIYTTNRSFENSIMPNYICYDSVLCQHIYSPTVFKLNRTCNHWYEILNSSNNSQQQWSTLVHAVHEAFDPCILPRSTQHANLFSCGNHALVSKYRMNDDFIDCSNGHDEIVNHNTCELTSNTRFRCEKEVNRCIVRRKLLDTKLDCSDVSDEDKNYQCLNRDDFGCRWKRGSLGSFFYFTFAYLCNGFVHAEVNNDTDESDCLSTWVNDCNSTFARCDRHWHCRDGRDELRCDYSAIGSDYPFYHNCSKNEQFYCINKTGIQLDCLPTSLAGDNVEHCVGATDERVGGFCQKK